MRMVENLPTALAEIAKGRDHVRTSEFARAFSRDSQTVRKNHSLNGECFGIRPVKVGKLLLWPVKEIAAVLKGAATK